MKIHVSAVCGTAMGSLAGLLREKGHEVTGSDENVYPPMSDQLAKLGVTLRSPYAEANVPEDADLVVLGNALSRGNPEVEIVLDRRQPYTSMPALLAQEFLRGRTSLVVAGTHGKTTTTSIVAHLLHAVGLDPSYLIGGVPTGFERSSHLGGGAHFVVEGDEYDSAFFDKRPKFLHYLPDVALIGNLEYDHADIYPDLAAVQTAFLRLIQLIPRRGALVAGVGSPALAELLPKALCRVETFGVGPDATWRAAAVTPGRTGWSFDLLREGRSLGSFTLPMPGEHNVRNAVGAIALCANAGVEPEALREPLAAFRGVKRRLEMRGEERGVIVYDDFAHHPTAVRETLRAVRRLVEASGEGRLVAVFEPRSYTSRTRIFQEEFARSFAEADRVIVASAHMPGKVPEAERISEQDMVRGICALGRQADHVATVPDIVERLVGELRPGDRVVILSNGGFGGIHGRLLDALR